MDNCISGKEILSLASLLAIKLTDDLEGSELLRLKLLINQLSNDINTIYLSKALNKR